MKEIEVGDLVISRIDHKRNEVCKVLKILNESGFNRAISIEYKGRVISQFSSSYRLATPKEIKESEIKNLFRK